MSVRTRATYDQYDMIREALAARKVEITQERPSKEALTRQLEKELSFRVPFVTVCNLLKKLGMDYQAKRQAVQARQSHSDDIHLQAEVARLRGLVHHLYAKLGEVPPAGYALPVNGQAGPALVNGTLPGV